MHQSFNLSVSQSVNQSINLSVNLPINQSVSLSIHESMNDYIIRIFCNNVDVLIRLFQFQENQSQKVATTSIAFENVSPLWGFCVQHIRISTALWRSFVCRLKEYSRTKVNNSQWKRSANILLCRFAWKHLFFFFSCFTLWVIIVSWSIWTVHYGYVK